MFASVDVAREAFREVVDTAHVEQLVKALRPAIAFEPLSAAEEPRLGATRIGGAPDLASGCVWPVRPIPADIDEIVGRGGPNHADYIREHLSRAAPFQFLAQVDLKEAAQWASDLPDEGQLSFFYDLVVGPWDSGATLCRVFWDRTPSAKLARHAPPNTLPSSGRARAMRLRPSLRLPDVSSVEVQADAGLKALLEDNDVGVRLRKFRDRVYSYETAYQRHQLLGLPMPEQDDPRYQAVVVTAFGVQHLRRDEWKENWPAVREGASSWRLLMQVALDDYWQDRMSEGTVYFVIRNNDLAVQNFANVVAVYQQT